MFAASKSGKPAAAGATTDPNFNSTTLLLETTGTNGQQNNTFLDSSTNAITVTRTSAPTQGTFTPFSQTGWSVNIPNTANTNYLTVTASTSLLLNADFTVEMWANLPAGSTQSAYANLIKGAASPNNGICASFGGSLKYMVFCGTPSVSISSTVTSNDGLWHHLAFVRSGTTCTFYVDGIAAATTVTTSATFDFGSAGSMSIGSGLAGDNWTNCSISNLRIVKGTAVYTSAFTPPTSPLTAISGTSFLAFQNNYFKDNSSNNLALTVNGTTGATQATAFSPFAPTAAYSTSTVGGSGYFNGTSDFLTTAANTALAFGTGNWTIEFWMYKTISSNAYIIVIGADWGLSTGVSLISYSGNFALTAGSGSSLTLGVPLVAQWAHVAIVQSGTTVTLYQNGTSTGTITNSNNLTDNILKVGMTGSWSPINGYISNLRVVKGTAVYTANFTPPTAPLTAVSGTSLLLSATNAGIYDATSKNDISTISNAQASTVQSKFGGSSMLFNGTTDYLTAVDKPTLQLGTGDFTIEGWVYLTTGSTARGYISKGPSAATTGWELRFNAANFLRFEWTASFLVGTTTIPTNTWTFVTVVRSGTATGNVKLYVNGALYATSSVAVTDNFNQTDPLRIGIDRAGTAFFPGYTDEVRITKGIARYTAAFTPPTAPFPVN